MLNEIMNERNDKRFEEEVVKRLMRHNCVGHKDEKAATEMIKSKIEVMKQLGICVEDYKFYVTDNLLLYPNELQVKKVWSIHIEKK